jgi:hypothetical protein
MGIGSTLLTEVRRHEKTVALEDIFKTDKGAGDAGVFRVTTDEGVLYEMGLFGNWQNDTDRLLEFDRPARHRVRIYAQPRHVTRREVVLEKGESGVKVELEEIAVPYVELLLSEVLRITGSRNLSRVEEEVTVTRFVELFGGWEEDEIDGVMIRYVVREEVGEGAGMPSVDSKRCAALAETAFDTILRSRETDGWSVAEKQYHALESDEAKKVREYVEGVSICTYWSDVDCTELAEAIIEQERQEILESREAFQSFILAVRRGEEQSDISSFIESRLYPNEPLS